MSDACIYDRHLMSRLLRQLAVWSSFFTVLFLLSVFMDRMPTFLKSDPGLVMMLRYLAIQAPFWFWKALPLAFLGASLSVLEEATAGMEIIALESVGVSVWRIEASVFLLAGALWIAGMSGAESYAPSFNTSASTFLRSRIQKKDMHPKPLENFVAKASHGRYFVFGKYDPADQTFERFWMDEWREGSHVREVFAARGRYESVSGLWLLEQVSQRLYKGTGSGFRPAESLYSVKPSLALELSEDPSTLLPTSEGYEEMDFPRLRELMKVYRDRDVALRNISAEYGARFAWPVSFMVLALIASAVLSALPRRLFQGKLVLFGVTVAVGLAYWFLASLAKTLAAHGILPVDIASWGPHALLATGALLVKRNAG
ncbi:MAG: LptF/LptG family permease [Elusimicrobiota bacterium]